MTSSYSILFNFAGLVIITAFKPTIVTAQSCSCSLNTLQYPSNTLSPTINWQTATNCQYAGEHSVYNVCAGVTYQWSYCQSDGGNATQDLRLNLYSSSGNFLTCSGNFCDGDSPKISWTATFSGTVRVSTDRWTLTNFCSDNHNNECQHLRYRISGWTLPSTPPSPFSNSPQCDEVTITRNGTPPSCVTWYWQPAGCGNSPNFGSGATYIATLSGTYGIRARHDQTLEWSSSCSTVDILIKSNSTAASSINVSDNTICNDESTMLTVSGGSLGTGASWKWYRGGCGSISVGSGSSITVSPTSATTYYVRAEGDCNNTSCKSTTITVHSPIASASITGNSTVCEGAERTYTVSASNATSYIWGCPNGWNCSGCTSDSNSCTLTVGSNSGDVTVLTSNSCNELSASKSVSVNVLPGSVTIEGDNTVCQGDTVSYTASADNADTFSWTCPTGWSCPCSNTSEPCEMTAGSTSGDITVIPKNNSCGDGSTKSFSVSVVQTPIADFNASSLTLSRGGCISFVDLSSSSPDSWNWTFEGSTTSSSTLQNPTNICYETTGKFTVTLEVSNACDSDIETKTNYITVLSDAANFIDFGLTDSGPPLIDSINHTIYIKVLTGTILTNLVATFQLSAGATAFVSGVEQTSDTENNFSSPVTYTIVAEDGTTTQDWVVTVELNERPTDISLSNNSVKENMDKRTPVGIITTTDPDVGDSFTYELVAGTGDSDNELFAIEDDQLLSNEQFNFEVKSTYSVRIETNDGFGGKFSDEFTINIEDGNDTPSGISIDNMSLEENKEQNALIGEFSTTDEDPGDSHTYSLVSGEGDDDNNAFSISGNQLLSAISFDYETKDTLSILVETKDQADSSFQKKFTIEVINVNEPPEIKSQNFPPQIQTNSGSINLSVNFFDDSPTTTAEFYYKVITDSEFDDTIPNLDNDTWGISIPESWLESLGIEYYFTISDEKFTTVSDVGITMLSYGTNSITLPNLSFGGGVENWRMFSIPLELNNKSIESIFEDELGPYNNKSWRIVRYSSSIKGFQEYTIDFETIDRSKGYWFNSVRPLEVLVGPASVPVATWDNLSTITLNAGWTQIGNPYTFDVSWTDILDYPENNSQGVDRQLKVFNGGTSLSTTDVLEAFGGAYVNSPQSKVLKVPLKKAENGRYTSHQPDWFLSIHAEAGAFKNNISGLGMDSEADFSKDEFDEIRVPRFVKFVDITFDHPEYFMSHFARDVVPNQDNYIWEFTADTNVESYGVMLSFALNGDAGDNQLVLYDVAANESIDLRERNGYFFKGKTRKFRVLYGDDKFIADNIGKGQITLGWNYPNPFDKSTIIPFSIFGYDEEYSVEIDVMDLFGRTIASPFKGIVGQGFHEAEWNVESNAEKVRSGLYIYILKVKSKSINKVLYKRMIIK